MTTMDVRGQVDLSVHGIHPTGKVVWNPSTPVLYEHAIARGRGADRRGRPDRRRHRQAHRPLAAGQVHRARARAPRSASGGTATRSFAEDSFERLRDKVTDFLGNEETLYVIDAFAGADPAHRHRRFAS